MPFTQIAPTSIVLFSGTNEYACSYPEPTLSMPVEEREAFVDISTGTDPIRARMWMVDSIFSTLPSNVQNGSAPIGLKLRTVSNTLTSPQTSSDTNAGTGSLYRELAFATVFYLDSKRIARTGTGPGNVLLELRLQTEQAFFVYKPSTRVFNYLNDAKTAYVAGASNSSTGLTYTQVVANLVTDMGITVAGTFPYTGATVPQNLVFRHTNSGEALARVIRPLGIQLVADPYTNAPSGTVAYSWATYNYTNTADTSLLQALANCNASAGSGWYRDVKTGNIAPASLDVCFPKWPTPAATNVQDGTVERYTVSNVASPSTTGSITGTKASTFVGDHFDATSVTYTQNLSTIATERAAAYFNRCKLPEEVWQFSGAYAFLLGETIRRVRISADWDGCYTTVSRHGRYDQPREAWEDKWQTWWSPPRFPEYGEGLNAASTPRDDGAVDLFDQGQFAQYFRLTVVDGNPGTSAATCSLMYNVYAYSDSAKTSPLALTVSMTGSGQRIPNITYSSGAYGGGLFDSSAISGTNNKSGVVLLWTDEAPLAPTTCT